MKTTLLRLLPIVALTTGLMIPGSHVLAQDKPDVNFITQTTSKITVPDGMTEDDMWKMEQEYFDKVISKSAILKHYNIYRHAWGSLGATVVVTLEYATWEDIEKFSTVERDALEKAAWPDEAARKAFLKKMGSFNDPYHRDEIYTVSNTMRK
ncbi:MAG: hypothetical protein WAU70_06160 [Flavobacteriales bacterium]